MNYRKILWTSLGVLLFSGCGGVSPLPSGDKLEVDPKLPTPVLTQKGVVTEMNEVAFEWKSLKQTDIDGVKIYKSLADKNATSLIATIENKYSTHYVDLDVKPATAYHYVLRTFKGDSVSNPKDLNQVYTKDVLPSVAWIYAINGLPRMAKIIWRPHKDERVESYIIERRTIDDEEWERIATLHGRLQAEFIDTDLKDKYTYRYRIRVKTFDGIISTPSEIVKVVTKPLPPAISGLKATTNLPHKISLTWNKSNYKDFERYYLYRAEKKDGSYTLRAKLYNNHFTDPIAQDGVKYFYKVTQKDIDGLESLTNEIVMGSTLAKPFAPTIQDAKLQGNKIVVKWFKIDPRSVRYIVKVKVASGWFDTKETEYKTNNKYFTLTKVLPNTKYTFSVYAIDKFGIVSKGSNEVSVEVKDLKMEASTAPTTTSVKQQADETAEVISIDDISVEEK